MAVNPGGNKNICDEKRSTYEYIVYLPTPRDRHRGRRMSEYK